MAGLRKSACARKPAIRKTAGKNASPARACKPRSGRRKSAASKTSPKRWSQRVTRESDALDLQQGVFKLTSPEKIAASLKRSAEFSTSSDADPVSVAPRLTLVILAAAWWVPWATL